MKIMTLGDWMSLLEKCDDLRAVFNDVLNEEGKIRRTFNAEKLKDLEGARKQLAAEVMNLGVGYCKCGKTDAPCEHFVTTPHSDHPGFHILCAAQMAWPPPKEPQLCRTCCACQAHLALDENDRFPEHFRQGNTKDPRDTQRCPGTGSRDWENKK